MLRAQSLIVIKTRENLHEIEAFEEEYEPTERPRVKFLQEVRRIHLA
ncbi:hypothetical protein [Thermococcus sp.]